MATIGNLSVVFSSDIKQLQSGVDAAKKMLEDFKKDVEGVTKTLSDVSKAPVEIKASANTDGIKEAAKEVEELEETAEKSSPTVRVRVGGSVGREFAASIISQTNAYAKSLEELGKSAGAAAKASGSALASIGSVLDGTAASVSGIIVAVGKAEQAFGEWSEVIAGAAVATGVFVRYSGGLRSVMGLLSGSVSSGSRIMAGFGAAAAAATVGVTAYAAVTAVARTATSGLSNEAREHVNRWIAIGAAAVSATASIYAANGAFAAIYGSFRTSTSLADFFTQSMTRASASVTSFASAAIPYLSGLLNVLTLARVASGEFRDSLARIGSEAQSIQNMADRFGSTVEQMLVLDYAARSAGVGMSQLARAQQAFYTNVGKVRIGQLGTSEAQEAKFAFDRLGISIEELRNTSPQKVFALVSDRLVNVTDAADRAAIAFDLFGRQALNVLPALKGLKEAEADSRRLGTTLSGLNFSLFQDVNSSFDRAREAMANFTEAAAVGFAPLQAALQNAIADIVGGAASFVEPLRSGFAAFTVPFQQFIEVAARLANIFLRLAGIVAGVAVAFTDAAAMAPAWKVFGDAIKFVLTYFERMLDTAEDVARVFSSELNPALEAGASAMEQVVYVAQTFATVAILGGVFTAITSRWIDFEAVARRVWQTLSGLNWGKVFSGLGKAIKFVLIDTMNWSQRMVALGLQTYYGFISGFVQPFISRVAVIITGNAAMATSFMATGVTAAASFVIATAGLALIGVAIVALYQNFSRLGDFFANFGENMASLFTLDGLAEAGGAVVDALVQAFMTAFNYITGFFGRLITGIVMKVRGIKTPEKVDAATASVADVVASRKKQQQAVYQAAIAAADMVGTSTAEIKAPSEDVEALSRAVAASRSEMVAMSLDAAKFGEVGRKAFLAAKADFNTLQQQLANNTLELKVIVDEKGIKRSETAVEAFERRSREIRARLNENLNLADVISPEQFQQSAEEMRKTVQSAFAQVRSVMRGTDLGSDMNTDRFFPSSDEIKKRAEEFALKYQDELIKIEQDLQNGEFGTGQSAIRAAEQARESAKAKFDRNMGKIEADVSFASDIRKSLEDAFLSPLQKYEKRLREIQNNKSLTAQEKSLATVAEQKQMVESVFGKTAGASLRDKEEMFAKSSAKDEFGRTAFMSAEGSRAAGDARASAERNKLDIERRSAVGLEGTASQRLKAGADNIADVFGVTGKSLDEVRASLSPEKFAEYQEALKKNATAVKESLGVEQSSAGKFAEARAKLEQAFKDTVISEEERDRAVKKQRDDMLSSLGISKTPLSEFNDTLDAINRSSGELTKDEREKGLKEAKDRLLQALNIPKSPTQTITDAMEKLREAFDAGRITTLEFAKGANAAKDSLLQSLGIPLDPVLQLANRLGDLSEAFASDDITAAEFARGSEEARRTMLPGAEEESPVKKFQRDLDAVNRAVSSKLITSEDGEQRKRVLQAQLQEDIRPALDKLAPDRRAIESSDVRSKEGVDTFFRILRGNDNPSLKAQLDTARYTKILAEIASEPEAAVTVANITGR